MNSKDYSSSTYLRPVTAFVTTRKEIDPPITALMRDFRMHPSHPSNPSKPALPPKPRRRLQSPGAFLVPQYIPAYSNGSVSRPKTQEMVGVGTARKTITGANTPIVSLTTPIRSLLTTAQGSRLCRSGSTSAIQHNKEVIYNLHAHGDQAVKDVAWQREMRKSPFSSHAYDWKRSDQDLLKKTVSTGNLRLFLEDGTEVKEGKALVKVCYNYCRSCTRKMAPIQVKVQP